MAQARVPAAMALRPPAQSPARRVEASAAKSSTASAAAPSIALGARGRAAARRGFTHARGAIPSPRLRAVATGTEPADDTEDLVEVSDEAAAERAIYDLNTSEIYGIPKAEWISVSKPARYMGNEFGTVHKPWGSADVRFALTYPEIYEVGASNLGHIVLYTVLNETDGLLCDRSYMPEQTMIDVLERYGKELFAVENKRPLRDFDTLGFSLAYELGATNILAMLKMSNIPISWKDRDDAEGQAWDVEGGSYPLIFAGGPSATSNPEPYAEFFDYFALGDGEELLPEIGLSLRRSKAAGVSREEALFRLCTEVRGVYVPRFYDSPAGWGGAVFPTREGVPERVVRRVCAPDPFQQIGLVPFVETVHDRLTVEIRRGCTRGCRFCQPGMLTRPARDVDPDKVVDAVEMGMRKTGYNEFSLLSLSCSDYLALPSVGLQIKNRLKGENISLTLPSQRVDRFDQDIANIIGGARRPSLTFAPEAGTQRLRDIINKGLTNEEMLRGVKTGWEQGWMQVKLYFMIGLPGETDEDVLGIYETVKWLQSECTRGKMHLAVSLTISNFTPKPHTPFQWHTVSLEEFERKQALLGDSLRTLRQCKYNFTPVRLSAMEDFIGRGDRSISGVIKRAYELGATNDGWWEDMAASFDLWDKAIAEAGVDWKYRQVAGGNWDVMESMGDARYRKQGGGGKGRIDRGDMADERLDAPLPWDHVDTGIAKWWLKADLQKALEAATVPDCSHDVCSECGVCGDEFGENVVAEVPPIPTFDGHVQPDDTRVQRIRVVFGKEAGMTFVGHLDLQNTIERALRRAALPVSSTSGFHTRYRCAFALALPLGASSTCEMIELEMIEHADVGAIRAGLEKQFPPGLPVLDVLEVPLKKMSGKYNESMTQLLESTEYYAAVQPVEEGAGAGVDWGALVSRVMDLDTLAMEKVSKKKKRKTTVDLRPELLHMEVVQDPARSPAAPHYVHGPGLVLVRYRTTARSDGTMIRPEFLTKFFEAAGGPEVRVVHLHRSDIALAPYTEPKIDMKRLVMMGESRLQQSLFKTYGIEHREPVWVKARDKRNEEHKARIKALKKQYYKEMGEVRHGKQVNFKIWASRRGEAAAMERIQEEREADWKQRKEALLREKGKL